MTLLTVLTLDAAVLRRPDAAPTRCRPAAPQSRQLPRQAHPRLAAKQAAPQAQRLLRSNYYLFQGMRSRKMSIIRAAEQHHQSGG